MELAARMDEKLREVPHSLEIADADRAPLEHHRPVVALAAEDVGLGRRVRGDLDPIEDRPGRT
jgi:hypothetical protein